MLQSETLQIWTASREPDSSRPCKLQRADKPTSQLANTDLKEEKIAAVTTNAAAIDENDQPRIKQALILPLPACSTQYLISRVESNKQNVA